MKGFSEKDLLDRGFTRGPDGTWSKGQAANPCSSPEPSSKVVEPGPKRKAARSNKAKGGGKSIDERSDNYIAKPRFQLVVVSYRTDFIDASNACVKHLEDVLVSRGFLPDDAPKYCPAPRFIQCLVPAGDEERTELYLFSLTEASQPAS